MTMELKTGIKGSAEEMVTEENTAAKVGSGLLPVYATPSMIALIEKAAHTSIADGLEDGQGTVGTLMNVKHLSATPIGMKITAETELVEVDRRRLVFSVKAYDEAGLIGEGTHERFIIYNDKFLAKAESKKEK
ncbi:MAG: thioesterase family protein [Eubacteriales bacterium]|nr:thioesterase family protein [Eubacteriales bacterium]